MGLEKVNKLRKIWGNIPSHVEDSLKLSPSEVLDQYIDTLLIGENFYIIFNTSTAEMEYIHPSFTTILGYDYTQVDLPFLLEAIHPSDLPYFYHFEESAVRFFSNLPPDLFFKYKFSFDYRIKTKDGEYKRFLSQVIPISYFPEGGARTITIFTDITHLNVQGTPKLSFIGMKGAPTYHNVHLKEGFEIHIHPFTAKEHEILQLVVQGLRTEDIANKLHRSVFTIRNHRKNILRKSDCSSVSELIAKAIREGWV